MNRAFEEWKERAAAADLYTEARKRGAKLKKGSGAWRWTGPCPACGGVDRFSINVTKRIFNCRGSQGGDVISMVMHLDGGTFMQACESLTGEPPPNGKSEPLTPAQINESEKRRAEAQALQRATEAQQQTYEEDTREAALAIWNASSPIPGSTADFYLRSRGFQFEVYPPVLRSHPSLLYPNGKRYPGLVCRVDDLAGDLTAIWRIFLRSDGRKADVPNAKLGLGPAGGGAVRIGGLESKISVAEGVESALGYWMLTGCKRPCWAALSTSGLIGFEAPLSVESVCIAPDGDRPVKKVGADFAPAIPAGRKAAEALRAKLLPQGVACRIAAEPPPGLDFNDLWMAQVREEA